MRRSSLVYVVTAVSMPPDIAALVAAAHATAIRHELAARHAP